MPDWLYFRPDLLWVALLGLAVVAGFGYTLWLLIQDSRRYEPNKEELDG